MTELTPALRVAVIVRAKERCEYCGLAQAGQEAAFHIDHVQPRAVGGPTTEENLALSCVSCSLHKAARREATEAEIGEQVPLFHPRQQQWADHCCWIGERVEGIAQRWLL
jgi:hypothetical protein